MFSDGRMSNSRPTNNPNPKRDRTRDIERQRENRQTIKLLTYARGLLIGKNEDGKGWTQGALARVRPGGYEVDETDESATCFCTIGALRRARADLGMSYRIQSLAEDRLDKTMGSDDRDIEDINDDKRTRFPQVLIAFDFAIAGAGR